MIPVLNVRPELKEDYRDFLHELATTDFSGEIRSDFSSRLVTATDNSIYQILPQAVVFPKTTADVALVFELAKKEAYSDLTFSPRGGGTGTNGQSLSPGIIVDCSKYMRAILELNVSERWVRIQPGVILDQLNRELAHHGLFFAPTLSPSNRATLGGMINTDACGKGSRVYGRTSNHVLDLTVVLIDGTVWHQESMNAQALERAKAGSDTTAQALQLVDDLVKSKRDLIEEVFPKMDRFLTGYNLAAVYDAEGNFHPEQLICGSEGSLAMVTEARLNLMPIPAYKGLIAVKYAGFSQALADAMSLLSTDPTAIETVDEMILQLARKDEIWHHVKDLIGDDPNVKTVNLVEYTAQTEAELQELLTRIDPQGEGRLGCYTTVHDSEITALWNLRKKGVGLLGNMTGSRKPIAFVEDTAVPPHNLAAYIREFRALLDEYRITFAMYGHVDVGCLHVRPALDMQNPIDEKLVRLLSDKVVGLVRKYGGVMWAEHGKGFRSEYTPLFFGEELYQDLRRIKAAFDPQNRLNPGKVVLPAGSEDQLVQIEAPLRGHFDRQIAPKAQADFAPVISCNGNAACFNYDPGSVMCPSSKITADRIHSPKGRAALLREWLRQLSQAGDLGAMTGTEEASAGWLAKMRNRRQGQGDYSHAVYDALAGCLSCKACAGQCPIHVDIPDYKASFLRRYHTRYPRPLRDYLVGGLEAGLPLQALMPRLVNALLSFPPTRKCSEWITDLLDAPRLSTPTVKREMKRRGIQAVTPEELNHLSEEQRENAVVLMQDSFTSFYDAEVFWAGYQLLQRLGFNVFIANWMANGKPLHIKGFLDRFYEVAQANAKVHRALSRVPLVCIEPSIALTYRDEYTRILEKPLGFQVHLLQEWLVTKLKELTRAAPSAAPGRFALLGHCMEKTAVPASQAQWQQVFSALGCELEVLAVGCCGMAGTYGHEREHQTESRGIFELSWSRWFNDPKRAGTLLASGYSCRTQAARFAGSKPKHPVQALLAHLTSTG